MNILKYKVGIHWKETIAHEAVHARKRKIRSFTQSVAVKNCVSQPQT
jgi:hypothetical protein